MKSVTLWQVASLGRIKLVATDSNQLAWKVCSQTFEHMALSSCTDRANIVFSGVSNTYLRNSGIRADAKLIIRYCVDSLGELVVLILLEKNWHRIYKIYTRLSCIDVSCRHHHMFCPAAEHLHVLIYQSRPKTEQIGTGTWQTSEGSTGFVNQVVNQKYLSSHVCCCPFVSDLTNLVLFTPRGTNKYELTHGNGDLPCQRNKCTHNFKVEEKRR